MSRGFEQRRCFSLAVLLIIGGFYNFSFYLLIENEAHTQILNMFLRIILLFENDLSSIPVTPHFQLNVIKSYEIQISKKQTLKQKIEFYLFTFIYYLASSFCCIASIFKLLQIFNTRVQEERKHRLYFIPMLQSLLRKSNVLHVTHYLS